MSTTSPLSKAMPILSYFKKKSIDLLSFVFVIPMKSFNSFYCLLLLSASVLFLAACNTAEKTSSSLKGVNNQIFFESDSSSSFESTDNKVQVLFNGDNNTVTFKSKNSKFKSKNDQSVIIIEGNNNQFTRASRNIVDRSENAKDTLIIKGSGNEVTIRDSNSVYSTKSSISKRFYNGNATRWVFPSANLLLIEGNQNIGFEMLDKQYIKYSDAFSDFDSLASSGDPKYQYYLGQIHHYGLDTSVNCIEAITWYLKSADADFEKAQLVLGYMNETGECGIQADKKKAKYWYKLALENGSDLALKRLEGLDTK